MRAKRHSWWYAAAFIAAVCIAGCTFNTAKLNKTNAQKDEAARRNVNATGHALDAAKRQVDIVAAVAGADSKTPPVIGQSAARASRALDLGNDFNSRAQALLGLPAEDQAREVAALMSTNAQLSMAAELRQDALRVAEGRLLELARGYEAKLLALGAEKEAEQNKSIVRRFFSWGFSLLGVGGIILLVILCPAVIPIFTRVFAWIVGRLPALGKTLGVVAHDTMVRVVSGVSAAREELQSNPHKTYSGAEVMELLNTSLRENTDTKDRAVISQVKLANKLA